MSVDIETSSGDGADRSDGAVFVVFGVWLESVVVWKSVPDVPLVLCESADEAAMVVAQLRDELMRCEAVITSRGPELPPFGDFHYIRVPVELDRSHWSRYETALARKRNQLSG